MRLEKDETESGSLSLLHFVLAVRGFLSVSHTNIIIKLVKKFHIHSTN